MKSIKNPSLKVACAISENFVPDKLATLSLHTVYIGFKINGSPKFPRRHKLI